MCLSGADRRADQVTRAGRGYLRVDIRADWAMLCLQTATVGWVTEAYVEPVRKISTLVDQWRWRWR